MRTRRARNHRPSVDAVLSAIERESDAVLANPDLAFTAMCRVGGLVRSLKKAKLRPGARKRCARRWCSA